MDRQNKAEMIKELTHNFKDNEAAFVIEYKGLSVSQLTDLRRKLRQKNGQLQVAKVTLIKRAKQELGHDIALDDKLLMHQIALVFAKEAPATAKIICNFSKEFPTMKVVGGCLGAHVLTHEQIEAYAQLPSREILLAQLCGVLKAPIAKLVYLLKLNTARLSNVLKQIEEQKKKS